MMITCRLAVPVFAAIAFFGAAAEAGGIDVRELNAVTETMIVDMDIVSFGMLRTYQDGTPTKLDSVLSYKSVVDEGGWTGTLSGSYLGTGLTINYEGTVTQRSGTEDYDFSYTSVWNYGGEEFQNSGYGEYVDPDFGYKISVLEGKVSGSASIPLGGFFELSASVEKDLAEQSLTAEIGVGAGLNLPGAGRIAEAGGGFKLSQVTGEDESYLFARALWGLLHKEEVVDRTRIWHPDPPPDRQTPPPDPEPYQPPYWPPTPSDGPYPEIPTGGTPGFPTGGGGAYHQMYLGPGPVVPIPAAAWLFGSALLGLIGIAIRKKVA